MKKLAMVLACFALVSTAARAQVAKIALQHIGSVTLFDADQMAEALTAATDGDTLYLNEGTFKGGFTIDKQVAIIGSGAKTVIDNTITVSIRNTPTLKAHLLDAMLIQKGITFTLPVNGVKIRKCQFYGINFSAKCEDITIDRCYHRGGDTQAFYLSSNIKRMNVINSKIWYLRGDVQYAGDANFVNCNIYLLYNYNCQVKATYMNCIIGSWNYLNSNYDTTTTYVNCLCGKDNFTKSVNQNCWNYNNTNILDNTTSCSLTDDELRSKGYLGTDDTVVGVTGGSTPYDLVPSVPRVTDYTIKVDTQAKKLNVNIKVTAN